MRMVKVIKDIIVEEVPYLDFLQIRGFEPKYTPVYPHGMLATNEKIEYTVVTPKAFFENYKLDGRHIDSDKDFGNGEYATYSYADDATIYCKEEFIVMSPFIKGILGKYLKGVTEEVEEWKGKLHAQKTNSAIETSNLIKEIENLKGIVELWKDDALYYCKAWLKGESKQRTFWQRLKYLFTGEL